MLMYPKPGKKKKRSLHSPSILQPDGRTCWLCEHLDHNCTKYRYLEEHHIYGGPNRSISEQHGFKVKLCPAHHREGLEAVHQNIKNMRRLQQEAQRKYEETHTREQFMRLIGRNYLEEEDG